MPVVQCSVDGKPGYRWGESGKCYTYDEGDADAMMVARQRAYAQGQAAYSSGYGDEDCGCKEDVKLPSFVISALKKGLDLHKDGHSGDGLKPDTVRSATVGVQSGEWSDDKIIRAAAWLARHSDDRNLTKGRDWSDPPTPGYTAWLLWGDSGDGKGWDWIKKKAAEIKSKRENADDRDQATPAPPEDRIKGGRNKGKGKASSPSPKFNDRTNNALKRMVKDHNGSFGDDARKKATLPMLRKVYLRGLGAYSTSHRPGVTRAQWGFGRVKAFLKMLKNLKPDDPKYNGPDNDLLPAEHPLSSKKREADMKSEEGYRYNYEGYRKLYEGDFGKKFSELKYDLGKMLHYFGQKDLSGDERALKYAEGLTSFVNMVKEKAEYGLMARSSYYHTLGELTDFIVQIVSDADGADTSAAVSEMIRYAMSILEKCEARSYKEMDDAPSEDESHYDDARESFTKEFFQMVSDIQDYKSGQPASDRRAMLERRADSLILQADNGQDVDPVWYNALHKALTELRS